MEKNMKQKEGKCWKMRWCYIESNRWLPTNRSIVDEGADSHSLFRHLLVSVVLHVVFRISSAVGFEKSVYRDFIPQFGSASGGLGVACSKLGFATSVLEIDDVEVDIGVEFLEV